MAEQSSALVYTIGIFDARRSGPESGRAPPSGRGNRRRSFLPGANYSEVVAICERIARDIRNQYTIGYVSNSTARPGAYRTIRVSAGAAGHGKLFVRTRSGYIAGGESRPAEHEAVK